MISLPAAVVSILGTLAMVYRTKGRWTLASSLLFAGTTGWAVGGVAAVIDSTIAINFRFHNTLWVPAHFHTYFLMGVVLMIMGFLAHLTAKLSGREEPPALRRTILTLLLVGGYGFCSCSTLRALTMSPADMLPIPKNWHKASLTLG